MPSVTSCTLQRNQKPTETDDLGRLTLTLGYDIVTDAVMGHFAMMVAALSASPNPLPTYGSTYSYQGDTDSNAYCTNYKAAGVEGKQTRYTVDAIFKPPPDDVTVFEPNPFLRSAVVWLDKERRTKLVEKDIGGKVLRNYAGKVYDIPPELEAQSAIYVVEFNVATLSEVVGYTRGYENAVNSVPWTFLGVTIPTRCAHIQSITGTPPTKQGAYTYYRLSWRLRLATSDEQNWDFPAVERGYQYFKKAANGQFIKAPGSNDPALFPPNGEPEPVLLAQDGTKLPQGELGFTTRWRLLREVNFNAIPFSG
jgi:hypothetical protein